MVAILPSTIRNAFPSKIWFGFPQVMIFALVIIICSPLMID
jgi:hypothetical protein